MRQNNRAFALTLSLLLLLTVGAGCSRPAALDRIPFLAQKKEGPPPAAEAATVVLTTGSRVVITPTVLGIGSILFKERKTSVTLDGWKSQDKAELAWNRIESRETEASRLARDAWKKNQATAPVGQSPKEPEPVYEDSLVSGRLLVQNLRDSQSSFLPAFWPEGEHDLPDNGALFLSRDTFATLRETRKAPWHPGIFENPLTSVLPIPQEIVTQIALVKEKLQGKKEASELTADADFGTYRIRVDGADREVQTIVARDAALEYVILDNAKNPLILKATVSPRSFGPADVLTPLGLLKAFAGYAVTEISL